MNILRNYLYPIVTLMGSIIGVGFLSLPYITLEVGIWPMLFYFVFLTGVVLCIHVIFGKIALKTPDYKRFPGFVGFYLGDVAKAITLVTIILASFGGLLVYLIVGSQFLSTLLQPIFGGSVFIYAIGYFVLASAVVYLSVRAVSRVEFFSFVFLFCAFTLIAVSEFSKISLGNIALVGPAFFTDWRILFLPYGAIIFSLWGIGLIPEVEEMLMGRKKLLNSVIIISILISAAIYLLFIFLVLGISGTATSQSALVGLKGFLGEGLFVVAMCIGVVTTFTSFVTQGLFLKKVFVYDMKFPEGVAWIITCVVPLILLLAGFNSFIDLISLVGGFILGIEGILILLMYRKIGGKLIVIYPLAIVFLLGAVYSVVYFVR